MVAVLAFGMTSAQTNPKQVPPVQPEPPRADIEVKDKAKTDTEIQNDINRQGMGVPVQPRKDEIKMHGHVKSTPDADRVKDTVATTKKIEKLKKEIRTDKVILFCRNQKNGNQAQPDPNRRDKELRERQKRQLP